MDEGLPDPRDSILWTKEFFGDSQGYVTSGPFKNWEATHELTRVPGIKSLYRSVGGSPYGGLLTEHDWEYAVGRNLYEDLTYCVDPTFELIHGIVHEFVGGYMAESKSK